VRLRPLTEAECYARCYGQRGGERIEILRSSADGTPLTKGERLREEFERRLEARGPEPDAEAA